MGEILRRLRPSDLDEAADALRVSIAGGPRANGPFPLVEADGSLNGPFGVMLHAPAIGGALSSLGEAIRYRSSLDARLREIAILAVGATRRSGYEVWAHERVAASMGFSAEEISALTDGSWSSGDERESVVHQCAVVLAAGRDLPEELVQQLVSALGETGAVELVALVGYYCSLAMLLQSFQIDAP